MPDTPETLTVEEPDLLGRLLTSMLPIELDQFPIELSELRVADLILRDQSDSSELVGDKSADAIDPATRQP